MTVAADTIAAIATAVGGGVGIVRISGPAAEPIARALVPALPRAAPSHRMFLGVARDPQRGTVLDQVLVVVMRAPRSYTGEDVAELHGHGGAAALQALLGAALAAGARLATPGEFTRRALLAGKIDLTQAEAVAELIAAADGRALRAAQALRQGVLGRRVDEARRLIVAELAAIEGALDFPDEAAADVRDHGEDPGAAARLRGLGEALAAAAASYRRPLAAVPELVLVGAVNVGKSSLLNALVGRERALVDEQPGTTRDVVEADAQLGEARVRLVDTAGWRDDPGPLETRGQALAGARLQQAALALVVFDGARGWRALDEQVRAALPPGLPHLLVENKSDLARAGDAVPSAVRVSARTGAGLDQLRDRLVEWLALEDEPALPIASLRQASALGEAGHAIGRAASHLPAAGELAAVELRRALHQLGLVTGETVDEEVLDAIFARFCIGK
jgi:tRNA modification GTPase